MTMMNNSYTVCVKYTGWWDDCMEILEGIVFVVEKSNLYHEATGSIKY